MFLLLLILLTMLCCLLKSAQMSPRLSSCLSCIRNMRGEKRQMLVSVCVKSQSPDADGRDFQSCGETLVLLMSEVNREVEPEQNSLVCKYTDPQRTHLQHMNPKNTWQDQKNVWKTFLTFQEQPLKSCGTWYTYHHTAEGKTICRFV